MLKFFPFSEMMKRMWHFLSPLASPKLFYRYTQEWPKKLAFLTSFLCILGMCWGLVIAPADYQQGEAFRIIYVHVPAAFLSLSLYASMGWCAILLLVWRIKMAGVLLRVTAEIGASMALIALVTGSIWGRPMWGAWWVWDARLTSELILLFLYLGVLAIYHAFPRRETGDKVAAILTLIGLVDLPIIHYSVYWWSTLHQGATLSVLGKPKIASSMLYPLLVMCCGFLSYCIWRILTHAHTEILRREVKQQWVRRWFLEDK